MGWVGSLCEMLSLMVVGMFLQQCCGLVGFAFMMMTRYFVLKRKCSLVDRNCSCSLSKSILYQIVVTMFYDRHKVYLLKTVGFLESIGMERLPLFQCELNRV